MVMIFDFPFRFGIGSGARNLAALKPSNHTGFPNSAASDVWILSYYEALCDFHAVREQPFKQTPIRVVCEVVCKFEVYVQWKYNSP